MRKFAQPQRERAQAPGSGSDGLRETERWTLFYGFSSVRKSKGGCSAQLRVNYQTVGGAIARISIVLQFQK
jgi:hypothetical protein